MAEDEMFKVMRSGKRQKKQWKRMVTKPTFVGAGFTRKPPKYERFIRPSGVPLRPGATREATSVKCQRHTSSIGLAVKLRLPSLMIHSYNGAVHDDLI